MGRKKFADSSFFVMRRMGKAAMRFGMLEDGAAALVALSGGHASMAMLLGLVRRQRRIPTTVTFKAVHVPDGVHGPTPEVVGDLTALCERLAVELIVTAEDQPSRNHFQAIPHAEVLLDQMARLNTTSLVLGHTIEDRAISTLLAMTRDGEPQILPRKENVVLTDGREIEVVRPMCLAAGEPVARMAADEGLDYNKPVIEHPDTHAIREIRSFIGSRNSPITEMLSNICNAPANLHKEYMA